MYFIDRYFLKQPKLRRFVTRLLEGNRECDIKLLGTSFRVHSIKEHGYLRTSRIANSSALLRDELPVMLNLASLLCDGDTFVDCGANVGVYSLTLARMHRILPNTRYYAFEANPDTFSRLTEKATTLDVKAYNVALSNHSGSLEFVSGAVSHVFTTLENASKYSLSGERTKVPCRRLDEMEIEGNSLILKIDVEGQEKQVLEGASALFKAHRVKAVYLDGYKDKTIERFLIDNGFYLLNGKSLNPIRVGEFNLLAIRNNSSI